MSDRPRAVARVALAAAALATAGLTLAACAGPTPPPNIVPSSPPAAGQHIDPGSSTRPIAGLTDMTADQKHAELDSGFVAEWPAVSGTVKGVKLVGTNELDFTIDVSAPATAVAEWYRTVMASRAFVAGAESASGGSSTLRFSRAGVFYNVRITPTGPSTSQVFCAVAQGSAPSLK
jgi:hypothetical protein